jgi:hypothetical protein
VKIRHLRQKVVLATTFVILAIYIFIHIWIARGNHSFVFPKINEDATYFYTDKLPSFGIDFDKLTLNSKFGNVEACTMPSRSSNNVWILHLHSTNTLFYSDKNIWRYRIWNNLGVHIFTLNYITEENDKPTSSPEKMYQSAELALQFLEEKMEIPEDRILVYGEGLGAYPAVLLSKRNPKLGGLILENGITNLHDYLQDLFPIIAIRYLFKEEFPVIENLRKTEVPTLFIASEKDETFPHRHTKLLYEASPAIIKRIVMLKKNIQKIKNKDAKTYQKALSDFLKELKLRVI